MGELMHLVSRPNLELAWWRITTGGNHEYKGLYPRREQDVEFQLVLAEFAIERLLYRFGMSTYAEHFVLRGATLFRLWSAGRGSATWDLDLLGRGGSAVADVVQAVREVCALECDDGLVFDVDSVAGEEIRAADEYDGVSVRLEARLSGARIPVQVDVGFGDAVHAFIALALLELDDLCPPLSGRF